MPHENVFFTEKHLNDSLHNPKRAGTTHTDKEIQAAAALLGRDSVHVEANHIKRNKKSDEAKERLEYVRSEGEALGGGVVVLGARGGGGGGSGSGDDEEEEKEEEEEVPALTSFGSKPKKRGTGTMDACVMRIDTTALKGGGKEERKAAKPAEELDTENRWKTEARIAAGGTGGAAELNSLRRAAKALEGGVAESAAGRRAGLGTAAYLTRREEGAARVCDADDDDDFTPVLVAAEELEFDGDGWSKPPTELLALPSFGVAGDATSTAAAAAADAAAAAAATAASTAAAIVAAEEAMRVAAEAGAADRAEAAAAEAARSEREARKRARLQAEMAGGGGGASQANGELGTAAGGAKKKKKSGKRAPIVSFEMED